MRHVGEEGALGAARGVGGLLRLAQRLVGALPLGDVAGELEDEALAADVERPGGERHGEADAVTAEVDALALDPLPVPHPLDVGGRAVHHLRGVEIHLRPAEDLGDGVAVHGGGRRVGVDDDPVGAEDVDALARDGEDLPVALLADAQLGLALRDRGLRWPGGDGGGRRRWDGGDGALERGPAGGAVQQRDQVGEPPLLVPERRDGELRGDLAAVLAALDDGGVGGLAPGDRRREALQLLPAGPGRLEEAGGAPQRLLRGVAHGAREGRVDVDDARALIRRRAGLGEEERRAELRGRRGEEPLLAGDALQHLAEEGRVLLEHDAVRLGPGAGLDVEDGEDAQAAPARIAHRRDRAAAHLAASHAHGRRRGPRQRQALARLGIVRARVDGDVGDERGAVHLQRQLVEPHGEPLQPVPPREHEAEARHPQRRCRCAQRPRRQPRDPVRARIARDRPRLVLGRRLIRHVVLLACVWLTSDAAATRAARTGERGRFNSSAHPFHRWHAGLLEDCDLILGEATISSMAQRGVFP